MEGYKEVWHLGCRCLVNQDGDVYTENPKGQMIHRKWRYNHDGYPVVSATQKFLNGFRTIQVHVLVAKAFVKNPDPQTYTEVNHKDFNRANANASNLEWVTHRDNVRYSSEAGRYVRLYGKDNPNYGNNTLHKRYIEDKSYAKEKQSRPRGRNGRAKKCSLENYDLEYYLKFDCQRDAVDYLIDIGKVLPEDNKESIIKLLKRQQGYLDWHLVQI